MKICRLLLVRGAGSEKAWSSLCLVGECILGTLSEGFRGRAALKKERQAETPKHDFLWALRITAGGESRALSDQRPMCCASLSA